jgi:hypothetical protein
MDQSIHSTVYYFLYLLPIQFIITIYALWKKIFTKKGLYKYIILEVSLLGLFILGYIWIYYNLPHPAH